MLQRTRWLGITVACAACMLAALTVAPASFGRVLQRGNLPLPGGVYAGRTADGAKVTIHVRASGSDHAPLRATVRVACSRSTASLTTADGVFAGRFAERSATVRGRFDIATVSGRISAISSRCRGGRFHAALVKPGDVHVTTARYGPDKVAAMPMSMPMPKSMFNMGGAMQDFWSNGLKPPCSNCYLVAIVPDFVYPDGKVANYDTNVMMHHIVLFNDSARDATCPRWPQRVMASGNERTDIVFPRGYGYYVSGDEHWSMLAELMNMSMHAQKVEPQLTYYWVPASAHLQALTPMWLDENECGNSEYAIPKGRSDTVWHYTVPASLAGRIVAIAGHVHDYGTHISLTDTTDHRLVCNSVAGYGVNPAYMKNIDAMSGCTGTPLARIHAGDVLSLRSFYNSPIAESDVMGIMMAYVATHSPS